MTMVEKNFGWWPRSSIVDARVTHVEPLTTYAASIAAVRDDPRSYDGWFYPPLEPVRSTAKESKPLPEMPAPVYGLPATHRITATETWLDENSERFRYDGYFREVTFDADTSRAAASA